MREAFAAHRVGGALGWLILIIALSLILIVYVISRPHIDHIDVRQQAQLHSIETGLELFDSELKGYPPSDSNDVTGRAYCGAMKLAEAMVGQDLMGFHSKSAFRADGLDPNGDALYPARPDEANLRARYGPYLQAENANAFRLADVYGKGKTGPFPENALVLCDTFVHKRPNGKKTGMPILYYRARSSGTKHDPNNPDDPGSIYDYRDNLALISLGVPGDPNAVHPLANPKRFYMNIQNTQISEPTPYRRDSYILISAGWDGLYGTADDICNFEWKYRER